VYHRVELVIKVSYAFFNKWLSSKRGVVRAAGEMSTKVALYCEKSGFAFAVSIRFSVLSSKGKVPSRR